MTQPSPHDMTTEPVKASAPEALQFHSAMNDAGSHVRLWVVACLALALDLWSKHWAFDNLAPDEIRPLIENVLSLRRSVNAGALFGIGQGMVPLFIGASFVALGFVLYLFAYSDRSRKSLHLALSFVLAGSLGNLYDRSMVTADSITLRVSGSDRLDTYVCKIVEDIPSSSTVLIGAAPDGRNPKRFARNRIESRKTVGVVRDFLKIEPQIAKRDVWPWVFNIADSLLVTGVIILLINFWFERREHMRQFAPACDTAT